MRDAGILAIGVIAGVALTVGCLSAAMMEIERGKSMDDMLRKLAARSWMTEGKP